MAAAYVHRNATYNATATSPQAVTIATAAAAGNLLVVAVEQANTAKPVTLVADSQGNSYTTYSDTHKAGSISFSKLTTGLTTSDTITLTWSGSPGASIVTIDEFSGVIGTVDSHVQNGGTASAPSLTIGPTGSLTAGDLIVTFDALPADPVTLACSGYTLLAQVTSATSAQCVAYNLNGSSGTASATWTSSGTQGATGAIVAFFPTPSGNPNLLKHRSARTRSIGSSRGRF